MSTGTYARYSFLGGSSSSGSAITALTGDGTATGPGSVPFTLSTVNSNVGSFGSASSVSVFTVNAKGLITAASSTSILITESQVTNLVTDLAGKQPVGNYITALTGDGTASGPGSVAFTLATVNSNVGSFTNGSFTVNAKGLITAASSGTIGNLTDAGTDGITITGGTGAVLGSGTSIAQQKADTTHNGYLSSTDWNTFNGKGTVSSVAATVPAFMSISGSPITGSGTLAFTLSGTALPIANGGTGVTSATSSPTAGAFSAWDVNSNLSAFNHLEGYATTATAALTTTLTVASKYNQAFTGSTTQTVVLPAVSTLVTGQSYNILNLSSGVVTVQTSGLNTVQAMAANTQLTITCISTIGTGTASWTWNYSSTNAALPATNPMTTGGDIIYGGASGVPTRLANGSAGQTLTSAGGTSAPTWTTALNSSLYLLIQDQKPAGTAGGTFTSGSYQTRTLNTVVQDGIGTSLSSNQFTLPAGNYRIFARAPAYSVGLHKAVLQNITDASTTVVGSTAYSAASAGVMVDCLIIGYFTIAATKTFQIQHRCQTTEASDGFGIADNLANIEVYTSVEIFKM